MEKIYFVTAIDTDAGKSVATGILALYLKSRGVNVITQKMAQTGCSGISDDIVTHRSIMLEELYPEDKEGLTCHYLFPFPASPHLSASLAGMEIDPNRIISATETLAERYDTVIVEGVGGIMVPLRKDFTVFDYLVLTDYPVIIVTSGKLGSINHTLLTLEVCKSRGINVAGMLYNNHIETHPLITQDTLEMLRVRFSHYYPDACFIEFPLWDKGSEIPDFSGIFRS